MSRLPDGRELVARLALPLPVTVVGELWRGIAETLEGLGYTDVVISTAAGHAGAVIATPPGGAHPRSGPAAPEEGAPTAPST